MITTIISDSSYDYKYKQIFERIESVKVIEGSFKVLILSILNSKNPIFHVRYIKASGPLKGILRYFILISLLFLRGGKILYTCHNINEHNIKSKIINDFYRFLFSFLAFKIIYFDEIVRSYNYKIFHKKGVIANFGSFRDFLSHNFNKSNEFENIFGDWYFNKEIDVISVSSAKLNLSKRFFDQILDTDFVSVMISPQKNTVIPFIVQNQFRYYKSVYSELDEIFVNNKKLVGFVGHYNISVATSLYMFASYGIPVICYDIEPNNNLVSIHNIGEIITQNCDTNTIEEKINLIKNNYTFYQQNCEKFIEINSWEKSSVIHKNILF